MTETIGGDIGNQILAAVQGLGVRMDRLEARMEGLEARMNGLEAQVTDLRTQVTDLRTQVTDLRTQVTGLDSRMARQERLLEMLGAEFIKSRDELRADVHRLNVRIDVTDSTVVLMASVLRRPRELGEDLEKRLRELQTH
jgi:chromosome segregation ATPase